MPSHEEEPHNECWHQVPYGEECGICKFHREEAPKIAAELMKQRVKKEPDMDLSEFW